MPRARDIGEWNTVKAVSGDLPVAACSRSKIPFFTVPSSFHGQTDVAVYIYHAEHLLEVLAEM